MHQPKVCVVCHAQFTARREQQLTCCNRCYMWNQKHPGIADAPKMCGQCGKPLPAGASRAKKYCDPRCSSAFRKRKTRGVTARFMRHASCAHCGSQLEGDRAGRRFCGERCERREREYPGSAAFFADRRCERCDEPIPVEARYNKRHCTNRCTILANQDVRRARLASLPTERISRGKIYDRDGWICHICKDPVDPNLQDPDPMSPSLDHLIPLCDEETPGHVETNVALAHWQCNVAKNGRTRVEDWSYHLALSVSRRPPKANQLF